MSETPVLEERGREREKERGTGTGKEGEINLTRKALLRMEVC